MTASCSAPRLYSFQISSCYLKKSSFGGKGHASCLKTHAPQEALGNRHKAALQHLHGWMALLGLPARQGAAAEPQHRGGLQQIPAPEHIKRSESNGRGISPVPTTTQYHQIPALPQMLLQRTANGWFQFITMHFCIDTS